MSATIPPAAAGTREDDVSDQSSAAKTTERTGRLSRFLQRTGDEPTTDGPDGGGHDPLTGLPTRDQLGDLVQTSTVDSNRASTRSVLAFVDIGLLRDVNDSYGPDVGDQLLVAVADRLRSIDVPGTAAVRYGGAEFALVFSRVAKAEDANQIADFLVELLNPPYVLGGDQLTIDANVGVAISSDTHDSPADLIHDAHQALTAARDEGRGAAVVYDDSRRGRFATRIDEDRIRKALDDDEFLLHYQPIVRMDSGEIVGVEALLRWQAPGATNIGVLHPHDFMPLLEKAGLGARIGEVVLRKGCEQLARWNAQAPDRARLFLTCNVGARQLAANDFAATVARAVDESGINPWQLCLDITEEAVRFNRAGTWGALRALKDGGVKLGLDDFGTGSVSNVWLRELQLDLLRVDRVFTSGLGTALAAGFGLDNADATIIRHTVGMAHDLGILAVGQGIEDQAQADALAELGLDLAQGFHYGRPEGAAEITAIIAPESVATADAAWDPSQVLEGG